MTMFPMTADEIKRAHSKRMTTAELVELVFNLPMYVAFSDEVMAVEGASTFSADSDEALLATWDAVMEAIVTKLASDELWGTGGRPSVIQQLQQKQSQHNAELAARAWKAGRQAGIGASDVTAIPVEGQP